MRADWVAVVAVQYEPVSARFAAKTGKNTGKISEKSPWPDSRNTKAHKIGVFGDF